MVCFNIQLTEAQQRIVAHERELHSDEPVRRKGRRDPGGDHGDEHQGVQPETKIELLRKIASQGGPGPITMVLDNARYQRRREVEAVARELWIELLFLPGYSPNSNLIERLWRFIKKKALYGRGHRDFRAFRQANDDVLNDLPTRHRGALAQLLMLKFQTFDDVSLPVA